MPNMSGVELMREVRHRHPDLPVILSTGYTDESELRSALSEPAVRVLYKPWTPTDLREAVDGALGS
ncbi:Blue-light-activated protein [compost metagenome]